MKRIFTLMLMFSVVLAFAQRGEISTESKSDTSVWSKEANGEILMPGNWANATQVGTYRWVDADDNPLGWIYGNNTYGDTGAAMTFEVDGEVEVHGAYVWFGAVASGAGDIHFEVYEFDGTIGDLIVSTSIPMNDVVEFPTGEGVTPDMYEDAFYVDFGMGVPVDGDFAFVVDYGDIAWNAHGDGVGLASTVGSGASIAWIRNSDGVWGLATGVNPALTFDLGIFPHVSTGDDPPPNGTFMVTFQVDMAPAVAGGFDPQEHNVVLTGSFTGWAEPGTDNSIEMAWTGKSRSKETILYENFDGGAIPDGWLNLDEDGDGNVWTIVTTPGHGPYDGDYAVMSASWAGGTILYPDNWLVTPKLEGVTDDWELSWAVKTQDPAWPSETYDVLVSTTDPDPAEFTSIYSETLTDDEWEVHTLSLADFAGESIYIAFRHHDSSDWFQMLLDAIQVTGTPGDVDPPDDLIFSATVEVDAGQIQYKYFSDAFGAGWDGGEWTGDPNRTENITEDTEIFNEWGDLIISVVEVEAEEIILKLFPNPASSHITVESSSLINQVMVYDITGRVVMQSNVNEFSRTLDVSTLRGGFYLMQIHTEEGIEGRRFHVAR